MLFPPDDSPSFYRNGLYAYGNYIILANIMSSYIADSIRLANIVLYAAEKHIMSASIVSSSDAYSIILAVIMQYHADIA